jgi:hypothetical protein
VSLPASWRSAPKRAQPWIAKSFDHVAALPPKKKKK